MEECLLSLGNSLTGYGKVLSKGCVLHYIATHSACIFVCFNLFVATWELKSAIRNIGYEAWYHCLKACRTLRMAAQTIQCSKCDCLQSGHDMQVPVSGPWSNKQMTHLKLVDCRHNSDRLNEQHSLAADASETPTVTCLSDEKTTGTKPNVMIPVNDDSCRPLHCFQDKQLAEVEIISILHDELNLEVINKSQANVDCGLTSFDAGTCLATYNSSNVVAKITEAKELTPHILNSRKRPTDAFVTFRVSAKCSGHSSRYFTSQV